METYDLDWPRESAKPKHEDEFSWHDISTNRILDFHGNPQQAGLTVLSDGNHHMALEASLQHFLKQHPQLNDIFYVTLPPQVLNGILENQAIQIANLNLSIKPNIYIGPEPVLNTWFEKGHVSQPHIFAHSLGQAWLIRKGNPSGFNGVADLFKGDTRLFISNPVSEKASHQVYNNTLCKLALSNGLGADHLSRALSEGDNWVMHGNYVHHRETPEALASGQADVALVYYHLALRYTRIFPEIFEMIPLQGSGTLEVADFQETTEYAISMIKGDNEWAEPFSRYMQSPEVGNFYREHGLEQAG